LIFSPAIEYRKYFEDEKIMLHYTARNGYENEAWTAIGHLTKNPFLMNVGYFFAHQLSLFNITLRNKPINYKIPEGSHNYVISAKLKSFITENLLDDQIVVKHNTTSGVEKYGHTCIESQSALSEQGKKLPLYKISHTVALNLDGFQLINNHIENAMHIKNSNKEKEESGYSDVDNCDTEDNITFKIEGEEENTSEKQHLINKSDVVRKTYNGGTFQTPEIVEKNIKTNLTTKKREEERKYLNGEIKNFQFKKSEY
jgi:hypothetical protein